jgi:ATP-dependent DNA helicase 2 subunit 1
MSDFEWDTPEWAQSDSDESQSSKDRNSPTDNTRASGSSTNNDNTTSFSAIPGAQHIIILVDAHPSMFKPYIRTKSHHAGHAYISPFDAALIASEKLLHHRVNSVATTRTGKRDGVGIVLFNCPTVAQVENHMNDSLRRLMDLSPPGVDHIQTIRSCMDMDTHTSRVKDVDMDMDMDKDQSANAGSRVRNLHDELYATKREECDDNPENQRNNDDDDDDHAETSQSISLRSAFFDCNTIFNEATCVKKLSRTSKEAEDSKTVWIFTNEHDPIRSSEQERKLVQCAHRDLVENEVVIRLWALPRADRIPFDYKLFYDFIVFDQCQDGDNDNDNDNAGIIGSQGMLQHSPGENDLDLDGLLEQFSQAFGRVRKTQSIPMHLPDWYATSGTRTATETATATDANNHQNDAYSQSSSHPNSIGSYPGIMLDIYPMIRIKKKPIPITINARTKKRTKKSSQILSKVTGEIISSDRINTFVEFGGERVSMTKEEVANIKRASNGNPDDACLLLLGFKPRSALKNMHQFSLIDRTLFAYPNEQLVKGSKAAFATLHSAMIRKDVMGIGELLQRVTATSRLVAILPQEEQLFDDGEQEQPPGFLLVPMAYEDDIRAIPRTGDHVADEGMTSAAKDIIRNLNLDNDIIIGESFENPVLKSLWKYIESVALGTPLEEHDPDEDDTTWDKKGIMSVCGDQITAFNQLLPDDEVIVQERKRKAAPIITDYTGIDWFKEYNENALEDLTVDELKAYLRSQGERISGRKTDLIERVRTHLHERIESGEARRGGVIDDALTEDL